MQFRVVTREDWGAVDSPVEKDPMPQIKHVLFVHFTSTDPCYSIEQCSRNMQILQDRCIRNGGVDIYYNFMLGGDGNIYEGRGWFAKPNRYRRLDHLDPDTMAIGYLGDFKDPEPHKEQWIAAWKLLELGFRNKYISEDDFRLFYCS